MLADLEADVRVAWFGPLLDEPPDGTLEGSLDGGLEEMANLALEGERDDGDAVAAAAALQT